MSETEAAIYGGVAGGLIGGVLAIVGVLFGLFAERRLQRAGKLRCEVTVRIFNLSVRMPGGGFVSVSPSHPEASSAYTAECRFGIKLFNEKDVDTGLRDLHVMFFWREGEETHSIVQVPRPDYMLDHLEVLDLPSRRWVSLSLHAQLIEADARRLPKEELERVEFRGYFPTGRMFKQEIPEEPS